MAQQLFSDILTGQIGLDSFHEWLSGKSIQVINSSMNRTDFVLFVLKYIQEETNKFILSSSTSTTVKQSIKGSQSPPKTLFERRSYEVQSKSSEDECKNQRVPFQVINKATPIKTTTQQIAKNLNSVNEPRREYQQCMPGFDNRNILTSTPVHPRINSSRNDHFPVSPPSSFHSDQSSHTPRSSRSSRFNSSGGSHPFSPNSPHSPPFSPSSPLYSESFPDLGAKSRSRAPQSPCLGDYITTKPASQKSRKRIKPTQLSTPEKDVSNDCKKEIKIFGAVTRPFVPMISGQTEIKEQSNFDEERNLLKQKRTQCLKYSDDSLSNSVPSSMSGVGNIKGGEGQNSQIHTVPNSQFLDISVEHSVISSTPSSPQNVKSSMVEPDPGLVNCIDNIVKLSTVYSACLDANLVPNVTAELYSIFTLLTAVYKSKLSENSDTTKGSLELKKTKKSTSKTANCNDLLEDLCLSDNSQFNESLKISLQTTEKQQAAKVQYHNSTQNVPVRVFSSAHDCVMFSVIVLEKQIHTIKCLDKVTIKILVENARLSMFAPHLTPQLINIAKTKEANEASFTPISKTFTAENGPVLFHSETDNKHNFSSDMNFNFFKKQRDGFYDILHEWKMKNSDSVWASKRFPQRVQSLLAISDDPVNMMHLARLFCAQMSSSNNEQQSTEGLKLPGVPKDKLSRLEARFSKPAEGVGSPRPPPTFPSEQQFYQQFLQLATGSTFLQHVADCLVYRLGLLDHTDFFVDGLSIEESKAHVLACVTNCCLLAKFLGLIVFSPYKSNTPLMPDTLQAQIMVREQVVPPVNVLPHLQRALTTNRLVVTVPWVVAYLGMMDSVTPYLASYRPLLQLLLSIYRAFPLSHLSPLTNLMLRCSLGWLFDASSFPQHVFFSLISNSVVLGISKAEPADADVKDVVDQTLLSEVCPYLNHLRQLLALGTTAKQGAVRHITPVPAQLSVPTQLSIVHSMEIQLEECFLSGQSSSFRSTVEVIIDRISSSCIKHICSNVIAPAKEKANERVRKQKDLKNNDKEKVQTWVIEQCQATEAEVEVVVTEHCEVNLETALTVLLKADLSDPTIRRNTHAICARRCRERIVNWLNSHFKLTELFTKSILNNDAKPAIDLMRPLKNKTSVEHLETSTSPGDMIIELQDKLCECISYRASVLSEPQVISLINKALETLTHRNDVITIVGNIIFTLTVDFCIVLLAYSPWLVTSSVVSRLCALWTSCRTSGCSQLERIMSARNTLLLCQGGVPHARASWQQLSLLLVELLRHSPPLLTPSQLETQCVALFRLDWPPMVLSLMGTCLSSMLEKIKEDPICKQKPKFVLMLEWVNEMTEDLSKGDNFEDP